MYEDLFPNPNLNPTRTLVSKKGQIDPYVEFIFEIFTPKKLMWGSDWPVLTMAENYSEWFNLAMDYCNIFSNDEKLRDISKRKDISVINTTFQFDI